MDGTASGWYSVASMSNVELSCSVSFSLYKSFILFMKILSNVNWVTHAAEKSVSLH